MRLAGVGVLVALVAAPLAAQAAPSPARWSVTLNGRVIEAYSYAQSRRDEDCVISRRGSEERELVVRSLRPTVVTVARVGRRVEYRPAAIARVREAGTVGGRQWTESRRCRAGPVETTSGTCEPVAQPARRLRARFRWAGANRIWFRPPVRRAATINLCGLARSVVAGGWLNLAIGRVNEEALVAGRARRVVARGEVSRRRNVIEEQDFVVGETITVRWTLTFRRIRS
jgi:hypothetical protein